MITSWHNDELLIDDGERWVKYRLRRPNPEGPRWPIRYLMTANPHES